MVKKNWLVISAFILGVASLVIAILSTSLLRGIVPAIGGIVLAFFALRSSSTRNRIFALIGLACSIIAAILSAALIIAVLIETYTSYITQRKDWVLPGLLFFLANVLLDLFSKNKPLQQKRNFKFASIICAFVAATFYFMAYGRSASWLLLGGVFLIAATIFEMLSDEKRHSHLAGQICSISAVVISVYILIVLHT